SLRAWAERQVEAARTAEVGWWLERLSGGIAPLPIDLAGGANTVAATDAVDVMLDAAATAALLAEAPRAYRTQVDELLLAALAEAFAPWTGSRRLVVDLEGHGREDLDLDLSRTVGWFTSVFPVVVDLTDAAEPGAVIKAAKEQLRSVPGRGVGHGAVRWLGEGEPAAALRRLPAAEVAFNYLGQLEAGAAGGRLFALAGSGAGATQHASQPRPYLLEI